MTYRLIFINKLESCYKLYSIISVPNELHNFGKKQAPSILDCNIHIDVSTEPARNNLIPLCKLGRFELKKWIASTSEIIPTAEIVTELRTEINFDHGTTVKVLKLCWLRSTDHFMYKTQPISHI